jgi:hypothetical protein
MLNTEERTTQKEETWCSDLVGEWISARCVVGAKARGYRVLAGTLLDDFKTWCSGEGIGDQVTAAAFGRVMTARGLRVSGKDGGGRKYRGPVRLQPAHSANAVRDAAIASGLRAIGQLRRLP